MNEWVAAVPDCFFASTAEPQFDEKLLSRITQYTEFRSFFAERVPRLAARGEIKSKAMQSPEKQGKDEHRDTEVV